VPCNVAADRTVPEYADDKVAINNATMIKMEVTNLLDVLIPEVFTSSIPFLFETFAWSLKLNCKSITT